MALTSIQFRRRAVGGAAGAPSALKSGEPAYNMQDRTIYIGYGDNGSGGASSIRAIGRDDFWQNIPSNGSDGNVLFRTTTGVQWGSLPAGSVYTASGNGIELVGSEFSLNYSEVATGIGLGNYVTTTAANSAYQGKDADLTAIAGLAGTSGFLRKTATDTWTLDTTTYAPAAHTHSATDITSGVFDIARIPVLPGNKTIVSTGGIAALTAGQQSDIAEGTIVTTTDGRRWVYSGTGSKTAEASYIEMADTTPEWAVIANKPSFHLVATSGSYADLINKPTLGTMAAQNANSVAITGGTIDNVSLDGGTF